MIVPSVHRPDTSLGVVLRVTAWETRNDHQARVHF
jgi:hypothetical protein